MYSKDISVCVLECGCAVCVCLYWRVEVYLCVLIGKQKPICTFMRLYRLV